MSESSGEGLFVMLIVVIAVVIIVIFAGHAYPQIYGFLGQGNGIDKQTMTQMEDNFGNIITNIKNCQAINDYECVCDVMPNFPGTFVKPLTLDIQSSGTNMVIKLMSGKSKINENSVNANLQPMSIQNKNYEIETTLQTATQMTMEFKKQFPEIVTKGFVVSGKIYRKDKITSVFLVTSNKDDAESLQKQIDNFPLCQENRKAAVETFDDLILDIKSGFDQPKTRVLPVDYSITYDKNSIALKYKGYPVQEIVLNKVTNTINPQLAKLEPGLMCNTDTREFTRSVTLKIEKDTTNNCIIFQIVSY
jgi:hypothetical protein